MRRQVSLHCIKLCCMQAHLRSAFIKVKFGWLECTNICELNLMRCIAVTAVSDDAVCWAAMASPCRVDQDAQLTDIVYASQMVVQCHHAFQSVHGS